MEISVLQRLLIVYAPKYIRGALRDIWAFDARMADIVRTTSEPMIGQMRLTWWHEALSDGKGQGEPLVEALRRDASDVGLEGLLSAIEGWEVLLDPMPLPDSQLIAFAEHRGGGIFRQIGRLTGSFPAWLAQAGMGWALWDLSGHISHAETAQRAIMLAREFLADVPATGWPRSLASLRILAGLARQDALNGRIAPAQLQLRQYARIIWLGMRGG